jgi:hypothetical protein
LSTLADAPLLPSPDTMSAQRIVIMGAIPGRVARGGRTRTDLSYVAISQKSWAWWCSRNAIEFLVLDRPVPGPLSTTPPPIQRWQAARDLLQSLPSSARVAVVDADTMVRWDAPDFLAMAGNDLAAVNAGTKQWIQTSLDAYSIFFPGISLDWRSCFNSGVMVLNHLHVELLDRLLHFYLTQRSDLEQLQRKLDVGIDQTLLNYFARITEKPIRLLPSQFNHMRCCELSAALHQRYANGDNQVSEVEVARDLEGRREAFAFIEDAFIWHFTTTVRARTAVMTETWSRVCHRYL